jgi:hypothetical protein
VALRAATLAAFAWIFLALFGTLVAANGSTPTCYVRLGTGDRIVDALTGGAFVALVGLALGAVVCGGRAWRAGERSASLALLASSAALAAGALVAADAAAAVKCLLH